MNGRRLIPLWFACLAILLPLLVALGMIGGALASDGVSRGSPDRWSAAQVVAEIDRARRREGP